MARAWGHLLTPSFCPQEKLNEAVLTLNHMLHVRTPPLGDDDDEPLMDEESALQEINAKNMNTEIVAQMWKNYQSNVQFHLEGRPATPRD